MIIGARDLKPSDLGRQEVRCIFSMRPRTLIDGRVVWLERVVQRREVVREFVFPGFYNVCWSSWRTYSLDQWATLDDDQPAIELWSQE